jgi:osmotically-inducible protein OsmY
MKTDTKLKEALVAQLNFWVGYSARNLQVVVNDGIVTLRGCVPCYAEKKECAEIVRRGGGVKEVEDEVVVEIPETRQRTDAEIATAAADAINWITTVPLDSLKISAQAGKLILDGTVENPDQKQVVELVVRHLPGITGITNLITIKPQPLQPDDLCLKGKKPVEIDGNKELYEYSNR